MDDDQFRVLIDRLDKLLRLQTLEAVKGIPSERDKVAFLSNMDFNPTEIDKLLGKSPGYSSVVLSQLKKKAAKPAEQPQPQTPPSTPEVTA